MMGLTLDRVSVGYGGRLAVEEVSGSFAPGSKTALVGANGAGKTTLMNVLAGVARPSSGRVVRESGDRRAAAYLPQAPVIDRDYPVTVRTFVTLGGWRDFGAFGAASRGLANEVMAALRAVSLEDVADARIGALSVGQFRRVLFARLVVQRPALVLLDEPFAAVDEATTSLLLGILGRWHDEGRTVVAAMHDLDMVRAYFPQTLVLARRCVAWGATAAALPAAA